MIGTTILLIIIAVIVVVIIIVAAGGGLAGLGRFVAQCDLDDPTVRCETARVRLT